MDDNRQTSSKETPTASVEDRAAEFWYSLSNSWKKSQGAWLTALVVLACAAAAWSFWTWRSHSSGEQAHRMVGRAYLNMDNGRGDSAEVIFERVLKDFSGMEVAKAALQLGDLHFAKADYAVALVKFDRARQEGKGYPLLEGGALRGVAASQIQLKKYPEAEIALKSLLKSFQKVTGVASDRAKETEPQDLVPGLSQAMWQLVLVQEKLSKLDEGAKTAQQLRKLYPASREAGEAVRWLALNGKEL